MPGSPATELHRLSSRLRRQGGLLPRAWRELEWLVKRSPVPVIVKGVLRADDAVRYVEDADRARSLVSNHGSRHLDLRRCRPLPRSARSPPRFPAKPKSMSTAASASAPAFQGAGARRPRRDDRQPGGLGPHAQQSGPGCRSARAFAHRAYACHAIIEYIEHCKTLHAIWLHLPARTAGFSDLCCSYRAAFRWTAPRPDR